MIQVHSLRRYLSVGVINTVVGYATICLALLAGVGEVVANAIGYAVGFLCSFCLNRSWTFRHSGPVQRHFRRFLAVCLGGYAVNLLVLVIAYDLLSINVYVAQLLAMGSYTVVTYLGCLRYVFPPEGMNGEESDAAS